MKHALFVRWPTRLKITRTMATWIAYYVGWPPKLTGIIPNMFSSIWVHTSYTIRSSTVQKNDVDYAFGWHPCVQSMWQRGTGSKGDMLWILPSCLARIWSISATRMPQNQWRRAYVPMCLSYVCFVLQAVQQSGSTALKPISKNTIDSLAHPTSHAP